MLVKIPNQTDPDGDFILTCSTRITAYATSKLSSTSASFVEIFTIEFNIWKIWRALSISSARITYLRAKGDVSTVSISKVGMDTYGVGTGGVSMIVWRDFPLAPEVQPMRYREVWAMEFLAVKNVAPGRGIHEQSYSRKGVVAKAILVTYFICEHYLVIEF